MEIRPLGLLLALLMMLSADFSLARGSLALTCFGDKAIEASAALANMAERETATTTKLHAPVLGESGDGESFQCSFIVPPDYVTTGDPPELAFFGWVPAGQAAGVAGCTLPNDVTWNFKFRIYDNGTSTGQAETGSETTNTAQLSCEGCASAYCFEDEVWYEFSGDITDEAVNLAAGDFVVVRVERQDGTDDYTQQFNVWLAAVELDYPN